MGCPKNVKHFHELGDFHELTFSCYHRKPLLTNDVWRRMLAEAVDRAMKRWQFRLHAFVFMPEHVHLLAYPIEPEPRVDALLKAIKRPYSYRIKRRLIESNSPLLKALTVRERPGVRVFRYWQEGPGYDRNLKTVQAVMASIDYIHMNPVRRGLCERPEDWKWSSSRFYLQHGGGHVDPNIPLIHRLPAEFLVGESAT